MRSSSISLYTLPVFLLALGCSDSGGDPSTQDTPGATGGGLGDPNSPDPGGGTGGNGVLGSGGAGNTGGGFDGAGGADATGGVGGTQAGSGGSTPTTCTTPEVEVCNSYQVGEHCGLTFEIWTDSAGACMTNTATGFEAIWDEGDGNYLARKGVRPGSAAPIVTYSADYQPDGNSYLGVYGWTTSPLIEYYIIDSWGSWRPPGDQYELLGTVEADGGTYEIYNTERVNQPSIEGTKTFWQYWSVRTEKRTQGTITVAPHFEAWADFGLTLGDFHEVSMLVEGYHSSGQADVTVSFQ